MIKTTKLLLLLAAASPALLGAKCVEYDERFGGVVVTEQPSLPASDAGAGGPAAFTPGKACDSPSLAQLKVTNRRFNIECGCAETEGQVCTIPAGTLVRWQFADSEEHNVAGNMQLFGPSGEKLAGLWEHTFTTAGTYRYGCSIHSDMRGYSIVVK
jgi:plastocyanin